MSFARYLDAKRSVDDRALDRRVWDRLAEELGRKRPPLRVADVGAGAGNGVLRMVDRGLLDPWTTRVTLVEPNGELASEAERRLSARGVAVDSHRGDLDRFAANAGAGDLFDLVVAHAVLDLVELKPALGRLVALLGEGGLLYCPITFDGETIFEPAHEADDVVLDAYHRSMKPTGDGRTGRRLYHALKPLPVTLLELGSSDWIVHPVGNGYPADEAYFLQFLLDTVASAVSGRVERAVLADWVDVRRRQIESSDLVFIAHQIDALARKTGGSA